jgi:hypothetical protein
MCSAHQGVAGRAPAPRSPVSKLLLWHCLVQVTVAAVSGERVSTRALAARLLLAGGRLGELLRAFVWDLRAAAEPWHPASTSPTPSCCGLGAVQEPRCDGPPGAADQPDAVGGRAARPSGWGLLTAGLLSDLAVDVLDLLRALGRGAAPQELAALLASHTARRPAGGAQGRRRSGSEPGSGEGSGLESEGEGLGWAAAPSRGGCSAMGTDRGGTAPFAGAVPGWGSGTEPSGAPAEPASLPHPSDAPSMEALRRFSPALFTGAEPSRGGASAAPTATWKAPGLAEGLLSGSSPLALTRLPPYTPSAAPELVAAALSVPVSVAEHAARAAAAAADEGQAASRVAIAAAAAAALGASLVGTTPGGSTSAAMARAAGHAARGGPSVAGEPCFGLLWGLRASLAAQGPASPWLKADTAAPPESEPLEELWGHAGAQPADLAAGGSDQGPVSSQARADAPSVFSTTAAMDGPQQGGSTLGLNPLGSTPPWEERRVWEYPGPGPWTAAAGPWAAPERLLVTAGSGVCRPSSSASVSAAAAATVFQWGEQQLAVAPASLRALRALSPVLHVWLPSRRQAGGAGPIAFLRVPGLDDAASVRVMRQLLLWAHGVRPVAAVLEGGGRSAPGRHRRAQRSARAEDEEPCRPVPLPRSAALHELLAAEAGPAAADALLQLQQLWAAADFLAAEELLAGVEAELLRRCEAPPPLGPAAWAAALTLAAAHGDGSAGLGAGGRLAGLCAVALMRAPLELLCSRAALAAVAEGWTALEEGLGGCVRDALVSLVALGEGAEPEEAGEEPAQGGGAAGA